MNLYQGLRLLVTSMVVLTASCSGATPEASPTPKPSPTQPPGQPSAPPTATSPPAPSKPTVTLTATEPQPIATPMVCSPLEGLTLAQLPAAVVNPYAPPQWGSDEAHQGVDLADLQPENRLALPGRAVRATLGGRVAAVVEDRFPYGNAILIETSLERNAPSWIAGLDLPTPAPTLGPHPALTCPEPDPGSAWDPETRSLYLLYAHLLEPAALAPGDPVACGQVLGAVGASGNALNPHLHLEVRTGPAGARFESMAHYTASATEDEMGSYCLWRVSGWFQPVDPAGLLRGG